MEILRSYIRQVEVSKERERSKLEDLVRKTQNKKSFEDSLNFSQTDIKIFSELGKKVESRVDSKDIESKIIEKYSKKSRDLKNSQSKK